MSQREIVLQEINSLNALYLKNISEKVLLDMEAIIINYLNYNPEDAEMWLKLVMIEFTPPLEDYEKIESYIYAFIKYYPENIKGLLILAYAQYIWRGNIQNDVFLRLQKKCNTADAELLSMIYLAIAWYYQDIDEAKYEEFLLKSIHYFPSCVKSYDLLGELYLKKGRTFEGKKMLQMALNNIQIIDDYGIDITDVNNFFNESFKGIYMTTENVKFIQRRLNE